MNTAKNNNLRERIRKIAALAKDGVGGEADNARRLLEDLCKRYGVSIDEILDTETKKTYRFSIGREKIYKQLFAHCASFVTGKSEIRIWRIKRTGVLEIELTGYQYAELSSLFEWHKSNLKRDIKRVLETVAESYIYKHNLFAAKGDDNNEAKPLSPEDFIRIRRIFAMQAALGDEKYNKMLEA